MRQHILYLLAAAGIFTTDLAIKNHVEKNFKEHEDKQALGGLLVLRKYHNFGAFLNMGQKWTKAVALLSLFLTGMVGGALLLLLGEQGRVMLKTGLTLLLGGGFSNTYDRLRRGFVVDYFSFGVKWKRLSRIVFNVADFCIFIGAILAVLEER